MTAKSRKTRAKAKPAHIELGELASIPLNRLKLSDVNVRQVNVDEGIDELADSIATKSLLQSLSVRPIQDGEGVDTGDYHVQGGGRRWRALMRLVEHGRLAVDAPIPCIIKRSGLSQEDSLAENADRLSLHPLDEFRAFRDLVDAGRSIHDIAASFHVTPAVVRQRLRLAAVAPALHDAYAAGAMDLEDLMAFTVSDNHDQQLTVWDTAKDLQWNRADTIKARLTEKTVPAHDKRARFVTLEAYEAAGGQVMRDLFDDDCEGYLQDPDLLNRLAMEKLNAEADALKATGWKWVVVSLEVDYPARNGLETLIPLEADLTAEEHAALKAATAELEEMEALDDLDEAQTTRHDELSGLIEALENKPVVYKAEDMARGGGFVSLNHAGTLHVMVGYVRPEDRNNQETPDALHGVDALVSAKADIAGPALSDKLAQDLTSYRTVALREAMANDYSTAYLAVLHAMCLAVFYTSTGHTALQISARTGFANQAAGLGEWAPTTVMEKRHLALRRLLPEDAKNLWSALQDMDTTLHQQLFAHSASMTINAVREPHCKRIGEIGHANQLATAMDLNMITAGWTTTVENYLGRVTKPLILAAVREAVDANTATLLETLKKDVMAQEAQRLLTGTGWLPPLLRNPESSDTVDELPAFMDGDSDPDEEQIAA